MALTVTAAAVSRNFAAYQDAAVREPVIITKNGGPHTVLIAYEDYLRLSRRDRRVEATASLSDDDLAAVEQSVMEPSLDHLNAELLTDKHAAD
ncbi:prevent-host-death family protein [Sinorhizobium fredii]|uniref:Antitoxin n=1 Tax=Sinorhizobium fredii (strain USDA 257) TaxID=1185652 RepID=I3X467_SINF2|nr:type II toxin-antitoxin system Phd/YefM family antitoxin [Sinorhizobium fredii]AFL50673.1 prevent-host-death family protein [Sinorhizobium fredii USDA 257]